MFPNSTQQQNFGQQQRHQNYQTDNLSQPKRSEYDLGNSKNSQSIGQQINQQSLILKIASLMHQLINAKEKLFFYEDLCGKLRKQNDALSEKAKDLQNKLRDKQKEIWEKMQNINKMDSQKNILLEKIKNVQLQLSQKLKDKSCQLVPKLKKRAKQMGKINDLLEGQLKAANERIIELERTIEQKTSSLYFGEIQRLRESNMNINNLSQVKHRMTNTFASENSYARSRAFSNKIYKF